MSYVVRIDRPDAQSDFKVFTALPEAKRRFVAASVRTVDGDFTCLFLFGVAGKDNARRAVDSVKAGRAILLERDPWARIQRDIEADLDSIILEDPHA